MALKLSFYIAVAATIFGSFSQYYSTSSLNELEHVVRSWIGNVTNQTIPWGVVTGSIRFGAITASCCISSLADRIGLRNSLILSGVIAVIGSWCELLCKDLKSVALLLVGRVILGINFGLAIPLAAMYLAEICPERIVGKVTSVGLIVANFFDGPMVFLGLPQLLGTDKLWPLVLGFPLIPGLFQCLVLPFCPKAPFYQRFSGKDEVGAQISLDRLFDGRELEEAKRQLDAEAIRLAEKAETQEKKGFFKSLKNQKTFCSRIALALLLLTAYHSSGFSIFSNYSTGILEEMGLTEEFSHNATVIMFGVYFLGSLLGPFVVDKFGRRSLFLLFLTGSTFSCIAIFTLTSTKDVQWVAHANFGILCFLLCLIGITCTIPTLLVHELFEPEIRPLASSICYFYKNLLYVLVAIAYPEMRKHFGLSCSFLPFLVVQVLSLMILWHRLPETARFHPNESKSQIELDGIANRRSLFLLE